MSDDDNPLTLTSEPRAWRTIMPFRIEIRGRERSPPYDAPRLGHIRTIFDRWVSGDVGMERIKRESHKKPSGKAKVSEGLEDGWLPTSKLPSSTYTTYSYT